MRIARWLPIAACLPLCIPFELSNRHVVVDGRIGNQDHLRIVIDTGASGSVLDDARAASLGLALSGSQTSRGAGGVQEGSTARGVDLDLAGFALRDQTVGTLSLASLSAQSGHPFDGIVGWSLLADHVVEIDYPARCVRVHDPGAYRYLGPGVAIPITFKDRLPYVKAKLTLPDGRALAGKFVIDTGASTNLILSAQEVEREGILASLGKTIGMQARGVGGAHDVQLARVAKLEIGGIALDRPIAAIQEPGPGYISAPGTVGNIGGGILSRFKVVLDYPRKRIVLEPGPDLGRPFEADMSGIALTSLPPDFHRFKIARVTTGSPAAEAGLQAGDEIASVDGKSAGELELSDLREAWRVEGIDVKLGIVRGDERLEIALTTRRLI
jgi:hypothetical protein